jgi:hypothetical protein
VDTTQPNPAMAVIFGGGAIAQMASNIALGDIDGDGNTDLLFGAPHSAYGDSRTFAGQAFIVWGSSALRGARHGIDVVGYTAPPSLTRFIGARENDFLAISVATGYFDRARGEEVVLGVLQGGRTAGETSGAVLVFPGGSALRGQSFDQSEPETRAPFRIYGDSSARTFGFAVSTADINDDGYDDILAAAPISSGPAGTRTDAGEVFIIKGRPVLPATSSNAALIASTRIFGQANNGGGFGYALEGGGDLNNDGTPDLAAAAIFDNHPTLTSQDGVGRVFVLFGEPEPQDVWMFY